jgi:hypothetical protein
LAEEEHLMILEKRISDLENKFSQMAEKTGEVEDLVMVEQAGILEIKNMIEDVKAESSPEGQSIIPLFEERLRRMEGQLTILSRGIMQPGAQSPGQAFARSEASGPLPVSEVNRIYSRISDLERRISNQRSASGPAESSYMDYIKKAIEELAGVEGKTWSEMNKIEAMLGNLKESLKPSQEIDGKYIEDLELRVDELEKSVNNLINDFKLEKEVTVRQEPGGTLDVEATRLSGSVSGIYRKVEEDREELGKLSAELSDLSKRVEEINSDLQSSLSSEIDQFKARLDAVEARQKGLSQLKGVNPEDLENAIAKIGETSASTNENYRKDLADLKESISKVIERSNASSSMDTEMNELLKKISFLEDRLKTVHKVAGAKFGFRPVVLE